MLAHAARSAARSLRLAGAGRSICSSSPALVDAASQQSKEVRDRPHIHARQSSHTEHPQHRPAPTSARPRPPRTPPRPTRPHPLQEFLKKFEPHQGMLVPPEFPSNYLEKAAPAEAGAGVPDKLQFNFFVPHETVCKKEKVDLVLLPAVTGDFGAMPGHVPTVAQLRPGVITVHKELDKDVQKYFVSGGFAFIHADSSADVCAVEAVPLSDLDGDAVRAGLAEYTAKLASVQAKGDDYETAAAQVGVEVYSAMSAALGQ
jgi:F-type H+-transporting ATPase subunit delta